MIEVVARRAMDIARLLADAGPRRGARRRPFSCGLTGVILPLDTPFAADFRPVDRPISGVMNPPADEFHPPRSAEDLAAAQRMMGILRAGGDARRAKVRRVRQSVRTHTYENDLKLSVAVDRVVRELGQ